MVTSPLGKHLDREATLSAIDETADECYKAAKANTKDLYLLGYADGVDRAHEVVRALPASTRYAELERAARDADEGIACLTNWLHNVTPSPGLEELVRSCSAADMTPHDAYEHGRILRCFDIAAALRPHIEILARISDAIANLDKEQVDG